LLPGLESFRAENLLFVAVLAVGALFILGVRKLDRRIAGDVAAELKLRGIEPSAKPEPEPEEGDHDFADEAPSEHVMLTIGDKPSKLLKSGQDLRAIVDGLRVGEFVILSRGHFHFVQAICEADGFLMEIRGGRDHLHAEWQPRCGDRSPYFDNDVVAETLSAYQEKRPMMEEILWEPIGE